MSDSTGDVEGLVDTEVRIMSHTGVVDHGASRIGVRIDWYNRGWRVVVRESDVGLDHVFVIRHDETHEAKVWTTKGGRNASRIFAEFLIKRGDAFMIWLACNFRELSEWHKGQNRVSSGHGVGAFLVRGEKQVLITSI